MFFKKESQQPKVPKLQISSNESTSFQLGSRDLATARLKAALKNPINDDKPVLVRIAQIAAMGVEGKQVEISPASGGLPGRNLKGETVHPIQLSVKDGTDTLRTQDVGIDMKTGRLSNLNDASYNSAEVFDTASIGAGYNTSSWRSSTPHEDKDYRTVHDKHREEQGKEPYDWEKIGKEAKKLKAEQSPDWFNTGTFGKTQSTVLSESNSPLLPPWNEW